MGIELAQALEEIAELRKQNANLQIMLQAEREVRCNEEYLKKVTELEAQIEKMKCCSNCKHFNKEDDLEYCWNCERQLVNSLDNLSREEIIKDEWEIKENDSR